jgi:hypothetical protein
MLIKFFGTSPPPSSSSSSSSWSYLRVRKDRQTQERNSRACRRWRAIARRARDDDEDGTTCLMKKIFMFLCDKNLIKSSFRVCYMCTTYHGPDYLPKRSRRRRKKRWIVRSNNLTASTILRLAPFARCAALSNNQRWWQIRKNKKKKKENVW